MAGLEPDADVTPVYSTPSKWLTQKYPPLSTPDGAPDPAAYHRIFDPFHLGAFDAGRQSRVVHIGQLTEPPPRPRPPATIPSSLTDVLRGEPVPAAPDLGPWDVRVLVP